MFTIKIKKITNRESEIRPGRVFRLGRNKMDYEITKVSQYRFCYTRLSDGKKMESDNLILLGFIKKGRAIWIDEENKENEE